MQRRKFIVLFGGVAVALPIAVLAQSAALPRVGYVFFGTKGGSEASNDGLRRGLADKGYAIGQNLIFEERYADGDIDKVPALIAELLALKVNILVTVGTSASQIARRATSTVPIVFASGDPIGSGLVTSLSRPGGNMTGISLLAGDYSAKWLGLLRELLPNLRRVAVLANPDNPSIVKEAEQMRVAARALGIDLTIFSAKRLEVEDNLTAISKGGYESLVITTDPLLESYTARIIAFASERRLPTLYPFSAAVEQGGLMSYSVDLFDMWRRAASYIDRILKGEQPGALPVEQPTSVVLKINLKTAKNLGLNVPPSLLATADAVIE